MSTVKLRILSQNLENYSFLPNGENDGLNPSWKRKGGTEFEVEVDSDLLLYMNSDVIRVIKLMLEERCCVGWRYEYISHELVWDDPKKLDSERFMELFRTLEEDVILE